MYIAGVVVALALWIAKVVFVFVQLNSVQQRNLNKIGKRLSWLTLTAKPLKKSDIDASITLKVFKFFIIWLVIPFFLIFTSWVYVFFFLAGVIYSFYRNIGKPQAVKEFQWKLKNMDLSFDQIIDGFSQIAELSPEDTTEAKKHIRDQMKRDGLI